MRLKQRLEQLESNTGHGGNLTVDTRAMTAIEADQAIANAERKVGKHGCVTIVWSAIDRPLPRNAQVILRLQPGYWDRL